MTEYFVSWHIQIEANSEREAAEKALEIQRDPKSTATVFDVKRGSRKTEIDLQESDHE